VSRLDYLIYKPEESMWMAASSAEQQGERERERERKRASGLAEWLKSCLYCRSSLVAARQAYGRIRILYDGLFKCAVLDNAAFKILRPGKGYRKPAYWGYGFAGFAMQREAALTLA
jgi:hypothetical protein